MTPSQILDPRRPAYLPQLDGLRGYGMLIVLLAHLPRPSDSIPAALIWQAEHLFKLGDIALDSFFIMSGFLITRLLLAERLRSGRISLRQFYLRRVLRIFPVYYLTVLVVLLVWPTTLGRSASLLFYAYNIYLPFHPSAYPLEQSWSLAVEEQFYLLWPLLVIFLPPRWLGRTTLVILPLSAIAAALTFAAVMPSSLAAELIYTMLPTRMLPLALGCFLAVFEQRGRHVSLRAAGLVSALGACVLLGATMGRSAGIVPPGGFYWAMLLPGLTMLALGFVATLISPVAPNWMIAPFRAAVPRFLGQISYAVYLVHIPLLFTFGLNDAALSGGPAPVRWSLLVAALSFAIACASWLLIERPLGRLKSKLGRRAREAAASSIAVA